jgi:hypothetical protein
VTPLATLLDLLVVAASLAATVVCVLVMRNRRNPARWLLVAPVCVALYVAFMGGAFALMLPTLAVPVLAGTSLVTVAFLWARRKTGPVAVVVMAVAVLLAGAGGVLGWVATNRVPAVPEYLVQDGAWYSADGDYGAESFGCRSGSWLARHGLTRLRQVGVLSAVRWDYELAAEVGRTSVAVVSKGGTGLPVFDGGYVELLVRTPQGCFQDFTGDGL